MLPGLVITLLALGGAGTDADMVEVRKVCPEIRVELRYATAQNGVRWAVYPKGARCLLRRSVAERLAKVQQHLARSGFGLKIWDAYRPLSVQKALWEATGRDRRFVADPRKGSKHNRGAAVDLTLVDQVGRDLVMPTDFDTFSPRAKPAFRGGTEEQRRNRDLLRRVMRVEGFLPDKNEWWHYNAPDWQRYPLANIPLTVSERGTFQR